MNYELTIEEKLKLENSVLKEQNFNLHIINVKHERNNILSEICKRLNCSVTEIKSLDIENGNLETN